MSIFNKKKSGDYSVLTDNYVPASLPTCGPGLENFVTADYPMNKSEIVEAGYHDVEAHLGGVISTCDHHSAGSECDHYIDAETEHCLSKVCVLSSSSTSDGLLFLLGFRLRLQP